MRCRQKRPKKKKIPLIESENLKIRSRFLIKSLAEAQCLVRCSSTSFLLVFFQSFLVFCGFFGLHFTWFF